MSGRDSYSLGQLLALCSAAALTPALRLLPSQTAALAGRGAWLSVLLALPAAAAYGAFLWLFLRRRRAGESLAALWRRAAGERFGALLLALCGLWLAFYAAFTLRDSAQRLIDTVYPQAERRLFILPLGLAAAVAGAGEAKRLVRTAKLVLPLMVAAVALTLCFALPELRADNLLPIAGRDALPLLRGTLPTLDAAGLILTLLFFLSEGLTGEARWRAVAARIGLLGALMAALVAAVVGAFGHELTARLSQPYFALVRCLVFFRALERMEALLVALWIFSDFLLTSAALLAARRCLAPILGEGRLPAVLAGAAAIICACLLAPGTAEFTALSTRLVPALNAAVCLLLIPGVFFVGKLRRRI
ncbi:MAG: GerAB/ArcD/ProY family transporter [Oscillospiraceae bacterium]|nr:GerAB/ArcD/ProY family transporter [Oscillospiraceae bacterium]